MILQQMTSDKFGHMVINGNIMHLVHHITYIHLTKFQNFYIW